MAESPRGWHLGTCTGCHANYWRQIGSSGTYCPHCSWTERGRLIGSLNVAEGRVENALYPLDGLTADLETIRGEAGEDVKVHAAAVLKKLADVRAALTLEPDRG